MTVDDQQKKKKNMRVIQGGSRKFLGHFKRHFGSLISSESSSHIKGIKHNVIATTSEFYHICVLQYAYAPLTVDLDLVSE